MSARIDVANYALVLLGEGPITSIEDDSDTARTMLSLYYIARNAVLEAHEWSFAIRRFTPTQSSSTPDWGWSFSYELPSDIIRLLRVDRDRAGGLTTQTSDMNRHQIAHELEGRVILCNESEIHCTGIRRVDDEGIFSPLFVEAFATKLAYLAAIPITESNQKQNNMAALYTAAINAAKSRDGMQGSTRRLRSHWLRKARGSGGFL